MTTTTRTPWTPKENAALARLYFNMLHAATHGHPYNKAQCIRAQQGNDVPGEAGPLQMRSRGSIEAKLMNATAAHEDLMVAGLIPGGPTMDGYGYRGLHNYQAALKDAILDQHRRIAMLDDYQAALKSEGVA